MKFYKANNPSDMAKLLPGVYWMKGWRGNKEPHIVWVYLHHRKNVRMISDGCEYSVRELQDSFGSDEIIFYGPIQPPSFEGV